MVTTFFGPPGCGKSTVCSAMIQKDIKKKVVTFCNYYVEGSHFLDVENLGQYNFPDGAHIYIDEAGLDFSNKTNDMSMRVVSFFKLHRHFTVSIFIFSQVFNDMQKKIRDLSVCLYHMRRIGPWLIMLRKINKFCTIDKESEDIKEGFRFAPLSGFLFFSPPIKFYWGPRWWKYFDSWAKPDLPMIELRKWNADMQKEMLMQGLTRLDKKRVKF